MVSVIKHFDNYPLLSEKYIDYELIKKSTSGWFKPFFYI